MAAACRRSFRRIDAIVGLMATTWKFAVGAILRLLLVVGLAAGQSAFASSAMLATGGGTHAMDMGAQGDCKACHPQAEAGYCAAACAAMSAVLVAASPMLPPRQPALWRLSDTDIHGLDPPPELAPPRA